MNNSKKTKMLYGLLVLAMTIVLPIACNDVTNDVSNINDTTDKLSLEEVMIVHRVAMEQAKNNFVSDESVTGLNEKIDYISAFNQSSISKMDLSDHKIQSLNSAIEDYKNMVVSFEYTSLSRQKIVSTNPVEIQQIVINDLESTGLFSNSEINLIRRISNSFALAEKGDIPPISIADSISVYKDFYENINASSEESKYTVGVVLAVAEESYTWWSANPDGIINIDGKPKAVMVANFVAQDAAGAIVGAGIAASYQLFQDDFDWGAVGWAAAGGAIVASTGVVGKIASWFT